jgi:hypothetical protein
LIKEGSKVISVKHIVELFPERSKIGVVQSFYEGLLGNKCAIVKCQKGTYNTTVYHLLEVEDDIKCRKIINS